jgi:hypothetical protein
MHSAAQTAAKIGPDVARAVSTPQTAMQDVV